MNEKIEVHIILPERAEDALSEGLRLLTRHLHRMGHEGARGFLGGEDGYGVEYENDTFMMHPFCWCERMDCPWCGGCDCPEEAFHYYVDGVEVSHDEWLRFYNHAVHGVDDVDRKHLQLPSNWEELADEANKHRSTSHDAVCDYCIGQGVFGPPAEPSQGAPNFWHKSSGLKVWWYKYIGRGMESNCPNGAAVEKVLDECLATLPDKKNES